MTTDTAPLTEREGSLDDHLDVLGHVTRRRLLRTLTDHHAINRTDAVDLAPDDADVHEVRVNLYHNHLPKLDEAGFVDWDRDTDEITRGPAFEEIEPMLRAVTNSETSYTEGRHE
jgi:hypothetical protein